MNIRHDGIGRAQAASRGFSLIEVMIAVVVLATGLLALAALQGRLTAAAADAKVRGRVAAMLSTRMDELRNGGYGALAEGGPTPTTSTAADDCDPATPDATDWIDCARVQAGLGSLTSNLTVATWYGAATFATPPPNPVDPSVAQFKRVTLSANWVDATGGSRQLAMVSDVSALALTNSLLIPPEDPNLGRGGPTVRTLDPATAGVIPIAMGSTSESATSNPIPELVGQRNNQQVVGTKFTVLNYTPPSNGAVVIQKRFETEVVKCACRYGAGGTNLPEIYRTAQWPAVWTGQRYDLYAPTPAAAAPGQAASSGQRSGALQSPLCQECCRDHHDAATTGPGRFDPERSDGSVSKYDLDNQNTLVVVNNTNTGDYVDACRLIRVDGFWRTASDLYSRQFGLLETTPVGGAEAKTGTPTPNAVNAYTGFVKNYLAQYDGTTGNAPPNGQSMFEGTAGINVPTTVTINPPSNSDYRYLHGRGLYVDYLEEKARTHLTDVLADTGPQGRCPSGTPIADCVLPNLPFTTANLTEIATWLASDTSVLTVNRGGNLLGTDPTQPSGGRTLGKAVGTSNNTGSMRNSNSGVAVNAVLTTLGGVDPGDTAEASDVQAFSVGGTVNAGPTFDVRVTGGGANPFVFFTLGTDVNRECLKPAGGDHHCVTAAGTILPLPGSVLVSNYWLENTTTQQVTAVCGGRTATDTIPVPTFHNFAVTAATIAGVSGSILAAANDGKTTESTTVSFGTIAANDLVMLTLAEQAGSPVYATIASCSTNGGGNKINNVVWTKPWTQP